MPQVLGHIPDEWPLRSIAPFLVRSLRKDLQRKEEGQSEFNQFCRHMLGLQAGSLLRLLCLAVLKAISASINLRVIDHALDAFARCPPVVEDGPPPGEVGPGEKTAIDGPASEAEKAGVLRHLPGDLPRTNHLEAQKERTTTAYDPDELNEIA